MDHNLKERVAALPINQSVLASDRVSIEDALRGLLPQPSSSVGKAMRYAVLGSGQRLRPLLALRTARVLGSDCRRALRSAAAVEMVHCASLIVDDLPCMDNDSVRRNRASVHVEFGEATAVLAAFALISLAARTVADQRCFQTKLLATLDCNSLIGGQSLDLELSGDRREQARRQVTNLKTVPLFQLAVEAGLAHGSPESAERACLLEFGRRFGTAYQMADDFLDGEIADDQSLSAQFEFAREILAPLGRSAGHLEDLLDYLNAKVWENGCSHR
jgi:farnesyl diphosphate synthase